MTYCKTSKSAYFMMCNSRACLFGLPGFCLGNRPESARCNLCVTVGHGLCTRVPSGPAATVAVALRQGWPYSAFTQKKHSRTCGETPASGHGRWNHPSLLFTSHTVSLHHDRDIEDVQPRPWPATSGQGGQMSSNKACKASKTCKCHTQCVQEDKHA